jgi:ABC-type branched-subunit amino acid transport system ATPase component
MIFMPGGIAGLVRSLTISRRLSDWWLTGSTATRQVAMATTTDDPAAFLKTLSTGRGAGGNGLLLTVAGLAKHFGGLKAVDGVDMEVRRGEIHALIGPNGSGKTTIINMLSGLYVPTAGRIVLDGVDITGRRPHDITAQGVARTFQNIRLFGDLTVLDNVMIGQHCRTKAGLVPSVLQPASQQAEEAVMRQKGLAALEFVGLRGKEFAEAKSLPYGRQRVLELARALVSDPKLLLLDEPAAGLNAAETEALLELLFQIRDHGITILIVEHDMSLVMNVSDQITVLNFGKKIAEGDAEAIQTNQEVIDAYLGTEMEVAYA